MAEIACLKLLSAAQTGDLITMRKLFELPDVQRFSADAGTWKAWSKNKYGNTPFHLACGNNRLCALEFLISRLGTNLLFAKNKAQMTPIHEAAINNSVKVSDFLLREIGNKLLSLKGGRYGHTPLHMAACNGHFEMVRLFLEHGAKIDQQIDDENNNHGGKECKCKVKAIHLAIYYGHVEVVRLMLEHCPRQVEEIDGFGNYLIHWAAGGGQVKMVKFLVEEYGADVDVRNSLLNTALHCSVATGQRDLVEFLVKCGADLDARNAKGAKPIQLAALCDQVAIVEILLDANPAHLNEATLHFASLGGSVSVVEMLLGRGADVTSLHQDSYTPLHLAAISGNVEITDILIRNEAPIVTFDASLPPPFHLAAFYGQFEVLKRFLEIKPDLISVKDVQGNYLIHWAALGGRSVIVRWLICERNCDIDQINDIFGYRPIHCASLAGSLDTVTALVEMGALCTTKSDNDQLPIHCAAANGYSRLVEFFVGTDPDVVSRRDKNASLPLHLATLNGHLQVVDALLKNCPSSIDEPGGNYGRTPLQMAADKGYLGLVAYLVETKHANLTATSRHGDMAIHLAAKRGHVEIVEFFLRKKRDLLKNAGHQAMLPLHLAAYFGHRSVAEICILRYHAGVDQLDSQRRTPLHYAAIGGRFEMVKFLKNLGANLAVQSSQLRLPIHLAALHGHLKIVEYLFADRPDSVKAVDSEGNGLLFYAVRSGNEEMVNFLLSKCAINLEARNMSGQTVLHLAAELGYSTIIDDLIKAGADFTALTNKEDNLGAIHLAAFSGQAEAVELLIDLKPDLIDMEDARGNKSIHLAALGGYLKVVELLLTKRHSDVEARDSHFGRTPLHCAAERGHADLVEALIRRHGANACSRSYESDARMTPLHLASWYGHLGAVQRLVMIDPKLMEAKDSRGLTPLMLAKQHRDNPRCVHVVNWLKKVEPKKCYVM